MHEISEIHRSPSFWARFTAASVFSYVRLYTEILKPCWATLRAKFYSSQKNSH